MDKIFYLSHAPINFHFRQTPDTFIVEEVPLYPFSGEGEWLVLKVRKKNLTTWEMINILSNFLGVKQKDIGYAGLKDKNALTYQYISIPAKYEEKLKNFSHPQIKIIEITRHKNKIRLGHLKGNNFFVRLKKVLPVAAKMIDEVLKKLSKEGLPNYFGYQRFGNDGKNYLLGKDIIDGKLNKLHPKKRKLYLSAYQSHLFNLWLSKRVEMSKIVESFDIKELQDILDLPKGVLKELKDQRAFFKILPGDVAKHYPYGKLFFVEDVKEEAKRFLERQIAPTGLLPGKAPRAEGIAREIEKDFDIDAPIRGDRRYAWVWPQNLEGRYKEESAWYELSFFLPKGSYATVLLEEIAHRPLKETSDES